MPRPLSFAVRRVIVWLLVGLLPLQALAAVAIVVAGPSHVHRAPAATQLVLDDFRRTAVQPVRVEGHAAGASGHFHGRAAAERHPHPSGDMTVLADRSEARQAADIGDSGSGPSLGVFLGIVSASPAWIGGRAAERPATTARWTPQTHDPDLPERPPRAA